jgi:hypothetical protein
MLELIEGAETVQARIQDLDLGRTFGGVLFVSNLVNNPDPDERLTLFRSVQRHLAPSGIRARRALRPGGRYRSVPDRARTVRNHDQGIR